MIVEGNAIAGNITQGIELDQGVNLTVEGNRVGQSVSGATMGNGGTGVEVRGVTGTIGGPGAAANTITGNFGAGIALDNDDARVPIAENAIFGNSGLGIDLVLDVAGATPNDPGDPDSGANTLQNTPVVTSAVLAGGQTAVAGTIDTNATTVLTVRFFASAACDSSGAGEGERFLGAAAVTTDGAGAGSFGATLPATAAGDQITATATGPGGTSEFSPCRAVEMPGPGGATIAPGTASVVEGDRATFTVTRSGSTAQDALVFVSSTDGSAQAGTDYDAVDTALFFDAGESTKSFTVATRQDTKAEGDESLTIALRSPVRVGLGSPSAATVTIAGNDRVPDSNIAKVKSPVAAAKLKRISGTASDPDGDLARVQVAIYQATGGARAAGSTPKRRPACRNINAAGKVAKGKVRARKRCLPTLFLRVRGTTKWTFRLPRSLPKGTWVIVARATDRAGRRETTFDAKDRNRVVVRVI